MLHPSCVPSSHSICTGSMEPFPKSPSWAFSGALWALLPPLLPALGSMAPAGAHPIQAPYPSAFSSCSSLRALSLSSAPDSCLPQPKESSWITVSSVPTLERPCGWLLRCVDHERQCSLLMGKAMSEHSVRPWCKERRLRFPQQPCLLPPKIISYTSSTQSSIYHYHRQFSLTFGSQ